MLCTLLLPTGGRATVAGYDVASEPDEVRLRIGVALQEAALDAEADRARAAPSAGPALRPAARTRSTQRVAELGELIDIGDALDRPHRHVLAAA